MANGIKFEEAGLSFIGQEASVKKYERAKRRERNVTEREYHKKCSSKRPRFFDDEYEDCEY